MDQPKYRHIEEIPHKFTDKQIAFLGEYLKTGSKVKAYRAAYDVKTEKDKSVAHMAGNTAKLWYMKAALDLIRYNALQIMNEKFMSVAIDAAWVLHRTALLADFNIRKFIRVDANGNAVYDFSNATDDDWYCISEYTVDEISKGSGEDQFFVDRVKLKTVDKLRALELVGKHISVQAWSEKIDLSSKDGTMTPTTIDTAQLSTSTLAELLSARTKAQQAQNADSPTDTDE